VRRHLLQGCPHEEAEPVTRWRHIEHITAVLLVRFGIAMFLFAALGILYGR
jgi:hypothetical protein